MADAARARGPRRKRLLLVGVGAGILLLILAILTRRSTVPQPPPIPDPNGYDVLVRAARIIEGAPPKQGDIADAAPDALRPWVAANREALEAADDGLAMPSGVPLTFTQADASMEDLGPLRMLGQLMLADALVARDEGRIDDAADRAIAAIRLARNSTRNGLMIHALVGIAIEEGVGLEGLRRLRDDLNESQCRAIARELLELDESSPTAEEILALEADWSWASMPRNIRISQALIPGVRFRLRALAKPAEDGLRAALRRASAARRLLAIDLAIRAHQAGNGGGLPDRLDDLVPEFLSAVPLDPFTDGPPIYRPAQEGSSYRLYSIGPDGKDDGGVPYPPRSDWTKAPGDLVAGPPSA